MASVNVIDAAKSFFCDICICAGIAANKRAAEYNVEGTLTNPDSENISKYKSAATTIIKELSTRTFSGAKKIESAISDLITYNACFGIKPTSNYPEIFAGKLTNQILYFLLAEACNLTRSYWDDSILGKDELDSLYIDSFLGIVKRVGAFKSQDHDRLVSYTTLIAIPDDAFIKKPGAASTTTSTTSSSSTTHTASMPYSRLGPLSKNVDTLVGSAGSKSYLSTVYSIVDKTRPGSRIFITPVDYRDGKSRGKKATLVRIGKANYDSDCTCYFNSFAEASDFLARIKSCHDKKLLEVAPNLLIAHGKLDRNGYYCVRSDLGNVYIKASRLNEELAEAFDIVECDVASTEKLAETTEPIEEDFPKDTIGIKDIDTFTRMSAMYD